jgi:hypothetical protein
MVRISSTLLIITARRRCGSNSFPVREEALPFVAAGAEGNVMRERVDQAQAHAVDRVHRRLFPLLEIRRVLGIGRKVARDHKWLVRRKPRRERVGDQGMQLRHVFCDLLDVLRRKRANRLVKEKLVRPEIAEGQCSRVAVQRRHDVGKRLLPAGRIKRAIID